MAEAAFTFWRTGPGSPGDTCPAWPPAPHETGPPHPPSSICGAGRASSPLVPRRPAQQAPPAQEAFMPRVALHDTKCSRNMYCLENYAQTRRAIACVNSCTSFSCARNIEKGKRRSSRAQLHETAALATASCKGDQEAHRRGGYCSRPRTRRAPGGAVLAAGATLRQVLLPGRLLADGPALTSHQG